MKTQQNHPRSWRRPSRRVNRYYGPERVYGQDGHQFEREILGRCRAIARGDTDFQIAIRLVRRGQPWDPKYPRGEAGRLQQAVARELNVQPQEVEVYTAIGSSLDYYHQIDGFFMFRGQVVTMDVTLNPNGKRREGAQVLISDFDQKTDFQFVAKEVRRWIEFGEKVMEAKG